MLGEPTKAERLKIQKRIRVMSAWKKQTGGEAFPEWMDLDAMAPGTDDIGNGIPDQEAMSYFQRQKAGWSRPRALSKAEYKQSASENRMRILLSVKARTGGIVGLVLTRSLRIRCTYQGIQQGTFSTYREAAAVYDRLARQNEGSEAITNDPEAVEREDKKLMADKRWNPVPVKVYEKRKKAWA